MRISCFVVIYLLILTADAALTMPIFEFSKDLGRLSIKLFHGHDETVLVTRLFFAAPITSLEHAVTTDGNLGGSGDAIVLPHAPVVLRYDPLALPKIQDAPIALMTRSRFTARSEHFQMATAIASRYGTETVVSDWESISRWSAGLFLDTHSSIWTKYACFELRDLSTAFPELALLTTHECVSSSNNYHDLSSLSAVELPQLEWQVRPYTYSMPRDTSDRRHCKHAGVWFLGEGRIVHPVFDNRTRDAALGCNGGDCIASTRAASPLYPVILDLESSRSYLPTELHAYCMGGHPHDNRFINVKLMDGTNQEEVFLPCQNTAVNVSYARNSGSQEIILGVDFAQRNFSALLFDAMNQRVYVTLTEPPVSESTRIVISLLLVLLNATGLHWVNSPSYAMMLLMTSHIKQAALSLPFNTIQAVFETSALVLSTAVTFTCLPFVLAHGPYVFYVMVVVVQWFLHVTIEIFLLALAPDVLRRLYIQVKTLKVGTDTPVDLPAPMVLARNAAHMLVIMNGIIIGLMLSQYSALMLLLVVAVEAFAFYHFAYYITTMLVVTLVFGRFARDSYFGSTIWGFYLLTELGSFTVLAVVFYTKFLDPLLNQINTFYPPIFMQTLAIIPLAATIVAGIATAFGQLTEFHKSKTSDNTAANKKSL